MLSMPASQPGGSFGDLEVLLDDRVLSGKLLKALSFIKPEHDVSVQVRESLSATCGV